MLVYSTGIFLIFQILDVHFKNDEKVENRNLNLVKQLDLV